MTTILVILGRISPNQFKSNFLKKEKKLLNFLLGFWNLNKILNILKKKMLSQA